MHVWLWRSIGPQSRTYLIDLCCSYHPGRGRDAGCCGGVRDEGDVPGQTAGGGTVSSALRLAGCGAGGQRAAGSSVSLARSLKLRRTPASKAAAGVNLFSSVICLVCLVTLFRSAGRGSVAIDTTVLATTSGPGALRSSSAIA